MPPLPQRFGPNTSPSSAKEFSLLTTSGLTTPLSAPNCNDRRSPSSVPPQSQCCTVQLSRLLLSHLPSRRLPALVRHFKFPIHTSHRAEADTLACWLLAQRLLSEIQSESDEVLLDKFGSQILALSAALEILHCNKSEALAAFERTEVRPLYISRKGIPFYQRRYVEQAYWHLHELRSDECDSV